MLSWIKSEWNVSKTLIAINVLVFIAMFLYDPTISSYTLVLFGAKFNPAIDIGQYYRFLTAAFIHLDIFHLLLNSMALGILGPMVEKVFGKARFLAIYLGAAIMGTALSYAFNPAISAGASGAIFGLLGTHVYLFLRKPKVYLSVFGKDFLILLGINILIGFSSPGIDNLGHLGGLFGGLLLASAFGIASDPIPQKIAFLSLPAFAILFWFLAF